MACNCEDPDNAEINVKEEAEEVTPPDVEDSAVLFNVDHSLIPQAQIDDTVMPSTIIQGVYDQSVFETNVLAQVEEATQREQRENVAAKRRLVAEIDREMKNVTGERLNELARKRQRVVSSLAEANSVAAVSSVLLDSREEAVRVGHATPFGTTVVQESAAFENFLAGIGTQRQKIAAKVHAHKKPTTSSFGDGPSTSAASDYRSSSAPLTLHSDMQSVDRLLKHKQVPIEPDFDDGDEDGEHEQRRPKPPSSPSKRKTNDVFIDDANLSNYLRRLRRWEKEDALFSQKGHETEKDVDPSLDQTSEIIVFDDGLRVPARLWRQLYAYQRTAVRWLWELHCQGHGGILADEMGLGKTIEICAFLFAVRLSRRADVGSASVSSRRYVGLGPVLIVCPATLLRQWCSELHIWSPVFRSVVLHNTTGTTSAPLTQLLLEVIKNASQAPPIIITTYSTLLLLGDAALSVDWHYVILDEGHKIRNPDAKVTILCKQFSTSHRLVVSGSPMQNNLKELWCLMDFVYPGKLGSQSEFLQHMAIPIVQGGYANASAVQLQTAYRCAVVLRDTISPYLLRRTKADVKASINLPSKTEQVLFCKLTDHQERIYVNYLNLTTVKRAVSGDVTQKTVVVLPSALKKGGTRHVLANQNKGAVFSALVRLRHICNHPDLGVSGSKGAHVQAAATRWHLSAKMVVVESLLKAWRAQDHRVLLFSQTRTMLDILEEFVNALGYVYYRMDGETPIVQRQNLINDFNEGRSNVFLFLLTTRVGGLGINLTGADRVIIYDPDWNPTTDTQARERAWRIGQTKDVVIYRLLTSGTIEEKVYHRQIFKQFLTNRVLKDPKQRRFFKVNDIHELFTYTGGGGDKNIVGKSQQNRRASLDSALKKEVSDPKKKGSSAKNAPSSEETAKKRALDLAKKLSHKLEIAKTKSADGDFPSSSKNDSPKKKHGGVVVDGVSVPNAVRLEVAKPTRTEAASGDLDEPSTSSRQSDPNNNEKYVLKRLLKCAGVSDSIDFESLVETRPDAAIIDAEASRVAEAAVQALRRSQQRMTSRFASTGPSPPRFGTIVKSHEPPVPQPGPSFGATFGASTNNGDDLLSVLRKRAAESGPVNNSLLDDDEDGRNEEDEEEDGVPNGASPNFTEIVDEETDTVLTDLRAFIAFQAFRPGQATSQEIVEAFGKDKRFDDQSFRVFRHLLRRICTFARRPSDGAGLWTLKTRFR